MKLNRNADYFKYKIEDYSMICCATDGLFDVLGS